MIATQHADTQVEGHGDQFVFRRRLGAGGFGEVFEAWDREQGSIVAVKRLKQQSPASIRRLKQEFRALAHLSHPNLAQLYRLVLDGEQWSFTMELVDGRDFLAATTDDAGRYDEVRLRGALRQLARGVAALHAAGKLHCDLKPHNVLVTDGGRVVILDFGMVREFHHASPDPTTFAGTPQYMAPELAGSGCVTTAADWYSVGVMLFEALVGKYPIEGGNVLQILLRKQLAEAPLDDAFPSETPVDLRLACQALLQREPTRRPTGGDLLAMLGEISRTAPDVVVREVVFDTPLVGRDAELGRLEAGAARVAADREPHVVELVGPSGIGKSALAGHFLNRQREGGALVWCSRCWENESVPYNAMDGIIDALVLYLAKLSEAAVEGLLTGHIAALARVFPAFEYLPIVRDFAARRSTFDATAMRRAAFRSLRTLLHRISTTERIVLLIDDAHWGDRDSADALVEVFGGRDGPAALIVLTYRQDEIAGSPFLVTLHDALDVATERVEVPRLGPVWAKALAEACGVNAERAAAIAVESGGDPYLVQHLSDPRSAGLGSVADAILQRIAGLTDDDRAFISALTIASRPTDGSLIHAVCDAQTDLGHILARLTNQRLLRQRAGGTEVECYHDRVRQAVRGQIAAPDRQALHLRLAETLHDRGARDPELLAFHFREGGDRPTSAIHARNAGDAALDLLAYDRAASSYANALRDGEWSDLQRRELNTELGTVLSYLGRGRQSANAFVEAARSGSEIESIALRRRAAEQLLRAGQFEQGLSLLNEVLADVGVAVPPSAAKLNAGLATSAVRHWWRGLRFEERDAPLDALEAERQDTLWAAANLMGTLDVKRGAYYTMLNARRSLEFGDLHRVGRTLALLAVHLASRASTRPRAAGLLDQAESLIARAGDPASLSLMVEFCRGMAASMSGDVSASHLCFADVERELAHTGRFVWERKLVEVHDLYNRYHLGQLSRLAEQIEEGAADALARDDMLHWSAVLMWSHVAHLMRDNPEAAWADLDRAAAAWQVPGGQLLHDFWRLQAQVRIALYTGQPADALAALKASWSGLRHGLFLALDLPRAIAFDLRARAHLGLAAQAHGDRSHHLRAACKDLRALRKIELPSAAASAELIAAQISLLERDSAAALDAFARAEVAFHGTGNELFLHAVRVRAAEVSGDTTARTRSLVWFQARGVVEPESFVTMLSPVGFL